MRHFLRSWRLLDPSAGGGTITLPPERVEQLSAAMETATKELKETKERMTDHNKRIGEALDKLKKLSEQGESTSAEAKKAREDLDNLAKSVSQLAEQHTNLLAQLRTTSRTLADSHARPDQAFTVRNRDMLTGMSDRSQGAVFASRRQAVELGYFFMATMGSDNGPKKYANRWLREQAKDLRYLPNMPKELYQDLGQDSKETFLRCQKYGLDHVVQDLGGTTTPGSVLVFPSFADTFIRNVEEHGVFRQDARIWPMGSDTVFIPRRKGGVSVFWVGEAQQGQTTDPDWDLLQMFAKKAMMLHYFSSELAEDENAAIALADLVMFEFSLAWAEEEDRIGFRGDGSGGNSPGFAGFVGVLGADSAAWAPGHDIDKTRLVIADSGDDTTADIKLAKLRQIIGACPTWSSRGARWYGHRTVHADVCAIETSGGGPVVGFSARNPDSVLGYTWRKVESMPASPGSANTRMFAFGNLRRSWTLGDRRMAQLETSQHFKFDTDQLALRFTARVAFLPTQPEGMVIYQTAS